MSPTHTSSCLAAFCTCAFPPTRWQTPTEHKEHDAVAQSQVQIECTWCNFNFLQSAGGSETELRSVAKLCVSNQNLVRLYFESGLWKTSQVKVVRIGQILFSVLFS